eukprot:NODE_7683_length_751_cov_625.297771_g7069_i0.p1 GENE.NODE_7683_length_751_cov_625.297771_g7069_i0~~NODE_7683_length_751_cov_625.297771_g7069_i0.p1  ORF type:complete len:205 (+),score=24.10 NODE_7683_length_751_cov_625.297771_g7069_i0:66-680(+)
MGVYTYIREIWNKKQSDVMRFNFRIKAWDFRHNHRLVRVTKPSRIDKARRLGYKAKQGFSIFRIRVGRGGRKRNVRKGIVYGKPKNAGITHLKNKKNTQAIAEARVGRAVGGLRVLNSYWVATDGSYAYYEVIMVDPSHKAIRRDPSINWIVNSTHKHREMRGKTSAGRKHRGLLHKGRRGHALRPSQKANWKKKNTMVFWKYR